MTAVFVRSNGSYWTQPIEAELSVYRFPVKKPLTVTVGDDLVPLAIDTDDYELCEHRMFDGRQIYVGRGVTVKRFYAMTPIPIDTESRKDARKLIEREVDRATAGMLPLDVEEREYVDREKGDIFYIRQRIVISMVGD